jgi:hypothetical protein
MMSRDLIAPAAIVATLLLAGPARAQQQQPSAPAPAGGHDHATPAGAAGTPAAGGRTKAPEGAYAYIGWPINGAVVHSTHVHVWFGLRGMGVAPAGTNVPNTGHHHVIVDAPLPPLDEPIPNDKNHLHYGKGQTEAVIELPPGVHTLQLLLGDAQHVPFDPPVMSKRITVYVRR